MPKICVIGLGYIGLPTASALATNGFQVYGVEIREDARRSIALGIPHIQEPGLKTLVEAAVKSGNLTVGASPQKADVFMICVPTPHDEKTHKADLRFVISAAKSIVPFLERGNLVILESTVTPGTTEKVLSPVLAKSGLSVPGDLKVAHCPERVLPGQLLKELVSNGRIIGGLDRESAEAARAIYSKFVNGEIVLTDARTAEMVKLSENTFRDVNVAYANELDNICSRLGIDVWEVIRLANRHPRVKILNPGPGVGGHCIAVDPWFLATAVPKEVSPLIRAARHVNDSRPEGVVRKIEAALKTVKKAKPKLALLGLTYKANIDDIRESPAMTIAKKLLLRKNIRVFPCDPNVAGLNGSMPLYSVEEALDGADVVALLVDHTQFLSLDWPAIIEEKGASRVLDFKGALRHIVFRAVENFK